MVTVTGSRTLGMGKAWLGPASDRPHFGLGLQTLSA